MSSPLGTWFMRIVISKLFTHLLIKAPDFAYSVFMRFSISIATEKIKFSPFPADVVLYFSF